MKKNFESMLPPNSTVLEKAIEKAMFRCTDLYVPIKSLWNPGIDFEEELSGKRSFVDQCPISFLPFLAWSLNIEIWNSEWSDEEKRSIIRKYIYIRKIRGTLEALKKAYDALGVKIRVKEWWSDLIPEGDERKRPYYFELTLFTRENSSITEQNQEAIHWMTSCLKPLRSQYDLYFVYNSEAAVALSLLCRITKISKLQGDLSLGV